jgi:hypothetical protein
MMIPAKLTRVCLNATVIIGALLAYANTAYCFIDVQIMGGQRSGAVNYTLTDGDHSKKVTATELGGALHVSPFPFVPVAFGVIGSSYNYNLNSLSNAIATDAIGTPNPLISTLGTGSRSGMVYGPDVMVWLPLGFFQPYVRLSYLLGTEKQTQKISIGTVSGVVPSGSTAFAVNDQYNVKETSYSFGFRFQPIIFFSVFAEYAIDRGTVTHSSTSFTTVETSDGAATTSTSTTMDPTEAKTRSTAVRVVRIGVQTGF